MTDKPLHVRVAEALGWQNPRVGEKNGGAWVANVPDQHWGPSVIPRYDESWNATGPLIERYGIRIAPIFDGRTWKADDGIDGCGQEKWDPQPLRAVCLYILAAKHAGTLEP